MSPSLPSPASLAHSNLAFIAWLPAEVIFHIFSYFDNPLHLQYASLTCRAWRSVAVDSRLWEPFYWQFYRSPTSSQNEKHHRILTQRRGDYRKAGMRAWLKKAIPSSLPADFMRPFMSRHESGELIFYEPLMKNTLAFVEMLGKEQMEEVVLQLMFFAMQNFSDSRPVDPEEGTQKIYNHLKKVFGRGPTPRDFLTAKLHSLSFAKTLARSCQIELPPLSMPPFLDPQVERKAGPRRRRLPNFHDLFVKRMSQDEELLRRLEEQSRLTTNKLDMMLRIVEKHGDEARDICFALIASQQLTAQTVGQLAVSAGEHHESRLRALDLHAGVAPPLLSRSNCLGLYNAAAQLLGHLQRREALQSIRAIRDRWSHGIPPHTLRERVMKSCAGIEEALATIALFRWGEKSEISGYLDVLALHVWANLETARGALATMRKGRASSPEDSFDDEKTTRHTLTEVHRVIRSLGFGVAYDSRFYDLNNFFIQASLWCPSRREGTTLIQTAIFCAVARRIGIAATLVDTPNSFMALIIEDGPQPPSWRNDEEKEWGRFCYLPNNDELCRVIELGGVKRWITKYGQPDQGDAESIVQPVSPLAILERLGLNLQAARERERREHPQPEEEDSPIRGTRAAASQESSTPPPVASPARDDLGALYSSLMDSPASLPSPLPPTVLRSSLALLPRGLRPASSSALKKDVEAACFWIFRIIDPSVVLGASRADAMFAQVFFGDSVGHDYYHLDATLLMEVNGLNVAKELDLARETAKRRGDAALYRYDSDEDGPINSGDEARGYSSRSQIRSFTAQLFALDRQASTGVAGIGGANPSTGHVSRDPSTRMLLDRSHPTNARVELRVGTVFKHRIHGWHGVVVGWDSECRASQGWYERNRVVSERLAVRRWALKLTIFLPPPSHRRTCYPLEGATSPSTTSSSWKTNHAAASRIATWSPYACHRAPRSTKLRNCCASSSLFSRRGA